MVEMLFTVQEMKTLVWALNSQLSQVRMRNIEEGKEQTDTEIRLGDMCGMAYRALTDEIYRTEE